MGLGSKEGVGAWMVSFPSPVLRKCSFTGVYILLMGKYIRQWDSPLSIFQRKLRIFAAVQLGKEG